MEIMQREMTFDSCVPSERIFVRIIEPAEKGQAKAVLQVTHGMAEHSLVYLGFARFMAAHGFVVAIDDHLGHGMSVSSGGAYGYFGEGGLHNVVEDMHKLHGLMHTDYPALPYYLMGHSMGSFLTRAYLAQYGRELSGAVIMGTCGSDGKAVYSAELALANRLIKKVGPKGHHPLFAKMSTEKFNKQFAPTRTASDWVSRDAAEVDRYVSDPLCGFDLTVSGYRDLVALQAEVNSSAWFKAVPDVPILLISGDKDPVGNMGRGVKQVYRRLVNTGHKVTLVLYPEARHALIIESNKGEVFNDLLNFLNSKSKEA